MIIRYVIGGPSEGEENSEKLDKILDEEQEQFGDLIRYYNIMEGYHYLQFKVFCLLGSQCYNDIGIVLFYQIRDLN